MEVCDLERDEFVKELVRVKAQLSAEVEAHKETERKLLEKSAGVNALLEQVPAILWAVDKNLDITLSVGSGLGGLKLKPGELVGTKLYDYLKVSGEPIDNKIEMHQRVLLGETFTFESLHRGRLLASHLEPMRGKDNCISGVLGIALDITDIKLNERELSEQNGILQLIAEGKTQDEIFSALILMIERLKGGALASILCLDEDGKHLIHGAGPSLPEAYCKIVDGLEIGPSVGSCGTAAYTGKTVIVEDIATNPLWAMGRSIALKYGLRACWSQPIFASDGRVLGTFAVYFPVVKSPEARDLKTLQTAAHLAAIAIERKRVDDALKATLDELKRDIARRWEMEKYLAESERRLTTLLNNLPGIAFRARPDPGFTVEFVSEGILSLTGYASAEFLSHKMNFSDLVIPEDRASLYENIEKALHEKRSFQATFRIRTKKGEEKWVWSQGCGVFTPEGEPIALEGFTTDMTNFKKLEHNLNQAIDDLRRSNEELERFAGVASHDLREPLRMVSNYCDLLKRDYADKLDENGKKFIAYATQGARRMSMLIQELLEYSRLGSEPKPFEDVDCANVVKQAMGDIAIAIRESKSEIIIDSLPRVKGDFNQLTLLFENLFTNAIKYRQKDVPPKLHITCERKGNSWVFGVADNGIGIAEKDYAQIFEIFRRLHTKDRYSGTGIGLATCRKIIENHRGKIWVTSELGKGTTFFFSLPILEHAQSLSDGTARAS
jgi:PAS domain S-box-containing protein